MPTSEPLGRVLCSVWAPGQQSSVRDAFLGQRESIVAALWPSKQAAGFEVPGGFAQAEMGDWGEACKPPPSLTVFVNWANQHDPGVFDVSREAGGGRHAVGAFEEHLSTPAEPAVPSRSRMQTRLSPEKPGTGMPWKETPGALPSRWRPGVWSRANCRCAVSLGHLFLFR